MLSSPPTKSPTVQCTPNDILPFFLALIRFSSVYVQGAYILPKFLTKKYNFYLPAGVYIFRANLIFPNFREGHF